MWKNKLIVLFVSIFLLFSCWDKINFNNLSEEKREEIILYHTKELKNLSWAYEMKKKISKKIENNNEIKNFLKSKKIKIDDKNISEENKKELLKLIKKNINMERNNLEILKKEIIIKKLEKKYPNVNFENFNYK